MKYIPVWRYFLGFCVFKGMRACDREAKAQRKEERIARKEKGHVFSSWITK